jgi:hypothetical protein
MSKKESKDFDKNHIHSLLVSMWRIQNSILQSYRRIFIAVEAILFGFVASIISKGDFPIIAFILVLLGFAISGFWLIICKDRGYNDSYLRWQILKLENGEQLSREVFTKFSKWQNKTMKEKYRDLSSDARVEELLHSSARKFVDEILPLVCMLCWVLVIVIPLIVVPVLKTLGFP